MYKPRTLWHTDRPFRLSDVRRRLARRAAGSEVRLIAGSCVGGGPIPSFQVVATRADTIRGELPVRDRNCLREGGARLVTRRRGPWRSRMV